MYYPGDFLRQTSPDFRFLGKFPAYIWQSWDFSCRKPLLITGNKHSKSDWLAANSGMEGNPCSLHLYEDGLTLRWSCKLAVTYSILTWSWVYRPQDVSLCFVIILPTYHTPANDRCTNTSASWERIRIEPNDGRFVQCITSWCTITTHTPVSPPRHCQCCDRVYYPGCTLKHCPYNWKQ